MEDEEKSKRKKSKVFSEVGRRRRVAIATR